MAEPLVKLEEIQGLLKRSRFTEDLLNSAAKVLRCRAEDVPHKVEDLQLEATLLRSEVERLGFKLQTKLEED